MPNEELIQRNYVKEGKLKGDPFGLFEVFNLGATTVNELVRFDLIKEVPESVDFPFAEFSPPVKPKSAKPDRVYLKRIGELSTVEAVAECKAPNQFNNDKKKLSACEQGLFTSAACGANLAIITDGSQYIYIDVTKSLKAKALHFLEEKRDLNPAVLQELLTGKPGILSDPSVLAERVWQAIWHATKEEPKPCLMTFVEVFILKFLSDNLPKRILPEALGFYELISCDSKTFLEKHGKTKIEYYVQNIRPQIKKVFPDKTLVANSEILELFGLKTLVSETSVINGFAFLKSGATSLATFDRTFVDILRYFSEFGPLTNIDPEFKLRLYETFLKKTPNKQKLGQFFTPRNIVKPMIRMAQLDKLPAGAVLLDPAAGVGGFVLEPLLQDHALQGNVAFQSGKPKLRVKIIGVEVDTNTHILAKANTLIHLAEFVRDPNVTVSALNQLMAEICLNIKTNQHLGTLEYPVREAADVILTNPPYVTRGSGIYKEEISAAGTRNGVDLSEYYDHCGLGLESIFCRYISGALKPGGRAFVIVPHGLLTRTEKALKEKLLSECNLIASIALPSNAFFSTAQKTYIIVLEKRHTTNDKRPDVFCAISTSIGESLDARRVPTPDDNTLAKIAEDYISLCNGDQITLQTHVRIVPPDEFTAIDRWDVKRFWSDEELVGLGAREEAIERLYFLNQAAEDINEIMEEMQNIKEEIKKLEEGPKKEVLLSDAKLFAIRHGKRVTQANGDGNPGPIPVYSGSKNPHRPLCTVTEAWALANDIPVETKPIVTVNANGYVGATFVRREKCIIHDDVMIIEINDPLIDHEYLRQKLRSAIAEGNFEYEAKLYSRVKDLSVQIPIFGGQFDFTRQKQIAEVFKRFDTLKDQLSELGQWANNARLKD